MWMRLNLGKFLDNGQAGYVLKPDAQRYPEKPLGDGVHKRLEVKVRRGEEAGSKGGSKEGRKRYP